MLRVTVEKTSNTAILHCQGRICFGEPLKELREAVLCHSNSVVKLDLAQVTRLDAAGLGVLAFLCRMSYAVGIDFSLVNPTRRVRDVLRIVKLDMLVQDLSPRHAPTSIAPEEDLPRLPAPRRPVSWPF